MDGEVRKITLSMKKAADYLGVSYWLVSELARRKEIPFSKLGGKYLFRTQSLNEYLAKKEQESIK